MKKFLQILAFVPFLIAPLACGTAVDQSGDDGYSATDPETPTYEPVSPVGPVDVTMKPEYEIGCANPIDCLKAKPVNPQWGQATDLSDLEAVPMDE